MAKAPKEEKPASTETKPKVEEEMKTETPSEPKAEENSAPAPAKTPDPPAETASCDIKGSQNGIYHVPGSTYYSRTKNVAQWFCSVEEAENAGYRAPKR